MMNRKHAQSGATLVVSMIMLVVLTLLVVSSIRSSTTNLRITGNMQVQGETAAAAQQAIEQVLLTSFETDPVAQTITVDMGIATYTATVSQPVCDGTSAVPVGDLDPNDTGDFACFGSAEPMAVTIASGASERQLQEASLCNQQVWEMQANVTHADSGATTSVVQGVRIRAGRTSGC
jgi:type II secretory pathway pseudopilin PulG